MRRGKGKVKKQAVVSSREDHEGGADEKIPVSNRRGRLQMQLKDDVEEDEVEKTEGDYGEDVEDSVSIEELKNQAAAEHGRKRKRSLQAKGNGITTKLSTGDLIKSVGYRQIGSRRKNKPRRAAEAVVECK